MIPHHLWTSFLLLPAVLRDVCGLGLSGSHLDRPRAGFFETVLETVADQKYCRPTGLIDDACCDFESVEEVNQKLHSRLQSLVKLPFFRYHKVDLYRDCPFWEDDGLCSIEACGVETTDEEHIPEKYRWRSLSAIETTEEKEARQILADGCYVRESDFCVQEDEQISNGLYVDLVANPERFTGYAGDSSSRVWRAIYQENCFGPVPYVDPSIGKDQGGQGYLGSSDLRSIREETSFDLDHQSHAQAQSPWFSSSGSSSLLSSLAAPRDEQDEETCLEKRVYYRIISGLHASISIHICDEYLDQNTGKWGQNLECFITRIAEHPERLQNVYFDYVLMLRALTKAADYVQSFDLRTGDSDMDRETKAAFNELISTAKTCPATFDEKSMFAAPETQYLKEEFKERFRNVSRIMDCVGCDKCRLWGRLQFTGIGTALKLLFSFDDAFAADSDISRNPATVPRLERAEIVAFVNTLNRLSESLVAVDGFRQLWQNADQELKRVPETPVSSSEVSASSSSQAPLPSSTSEENPQEAQTKPLKRKPLTWNFQPPPPPPPRHSSERPRYTIPPKNDQLKAANVFAPKRGAKENNNVSSGESQPFALFTWLYSWVSTASSSEDTHTDL